MPKKFYESGIRIAEVRVRNFRCLQSVDVTLDRVTVLLGENNAGKTSLLEAISMAIGASRHTISTEDIYLAPGERSVPRKRSVIIDILIRPTDRNGEYVDRFPAGSYWLELWGNSVSQDSDYHDFVGIRTQLRWSRSDGEYVSERKFIGEWPSDSSDIENLPLSQQLNTVLAFHTEPLALHYMDAKRDIRDDMSNRSSFWARLISDIGLTDKKIKELEEILNALNDEIIGNSRVLTHVGSHLNDLYRTITCDQQSVAITPIPRQLRNMNQGVDVNFATKGAQAFPLARHGMGTRSLASVLTFRAYMSWRQQKSRSSIHPMLAIEEPEAHLHPQAQRSLVQQIEEISGQIILSTHSPYVAAQMDVASFRHFHKVGARTEVTRLDMTGLGSDDIHKIERMVLNTRGDMLFARALVLFEGETEELALPIFAERYWNVPTSALGITLIGVGGSGRYLPFLRLASSYRIPWYIFSDGEADAQRALGSALRELGLTIQSPNVFMIPNGKNFEQYIVNSRYKTALIQMMLATNARNDHHRAVLEQEWANKADPLADLLGCLTSNKTKYAKAVAEAILSTHLKKYRFPDLVRDLFERISDDLGLRKQER